MLTLRRPFSSAKCGISQEMGSTASRVAWGRMNRLPPVVSSSTILVTVTSPICHCIIAPSFSNASISAMRAPCESHGGAAAMLDLA